MDFTCMTDAQIADYFKNATGKTCGRFNNTQLNRNIPLNYRQRLFRPLKYIAAWLMALEVTSFKAKASDTFDTTNYIFTGRYIGYYSTRIRYFKLCRYNRDELV